MDRLDPIDREALEHLAPHWALMTRVHDLRTRVFGGGGALGVAAAVALTVGVGVGTDASAFQLALVAAGTALVCLGVVRAAARRQAARLREQVRRHCAEHTVDLDELVVAARKLPGRLYFFAALWDPAEVDKK